MNDSQPAEGKSALGDSLQSVGGTESRVCIGSYPRPKHSRTSKQRRWSPGAFLAVREKDTERLTQWLDHYGLSATAFRLDDIDHFIRLIEDQRVSWVVVATAGTLLQQPQFTRLFRALIESETDLWTADNGRCFSDDLFCAAVENWDFIGPYASDAVKSLSLTSVRDSLSRIECHLQQQFVTDTPPQRSLDVPDESRRHLITKNDLVIDPSRFEVQYRNHPPLLLGNTKPFHLLKRLAQSPGIFIHINTLREDVWEDELVEPATISRTVRSLRATLREAGYDGITLDTSERHHVRLLLG